MTSFIERVFFRKGLSTKDDVNILVQDQKHDNWSTSSIMNDNNALYSIDDRRIPVGNLDDLMNMVNTGTFQEPPEPKKRYYSVKKGDTFQSIARRYVDVTTRMIVEANPDVNPSNLKVGQKIVIPYPKDDENLIPTGQSPVFIPYVINRGDTFQKIASEHDGITTNMVVTSNRDVNPSTLRVGQVINLPSNEKLPKLEEVYDKNTGEQVAKCAEDQAEKMNTVNWCARGVRYSLENAGILDKEEIMVQSAYQLKDEYDKNDAFTRVDVPSDKLKELPPGCVIVWQGRNGSGESFSKHGHVCISLGDGLEASDHVREMKMYDTDYAVFVPNKRSFA